MAVADLVKETTVQQAVDTLRRGGVKSKYENFIGGRWVAPVKGKYFTDYSPINGEPICEIARSSAEDVEKALDAAHAVKDLWGRTAPAVRSSILLKIADKMEENLELLALAETLDNGKPIRETRAADVPLSIDHFRYFAGCIRAEEGTVGEIDNDTIHALNERRHDVLSFFERVVCGLTRRDDVAENLAIADGIRFARSDCHGVRVDAGHQAANVLNCALSACLRELREELRRLRRRVGSQLAVAEVSLEVFPPDHAVRVNGVRSLVLRDVGLVGLGPEFQDGLIRFDRRDGLDRILCVEFVEERSRELPGLTLTVARIAHAARALHALRLAVDGASAVVSQMPCSERSIEVTLLVAHATNLSVYAMQCNGTKVMLPQ
jgi:Aldehyde dehydrogenase family